ncbi:putative Radical SAM domain-containing protein(Radical SAM, alpha/beta horseshoe,221-414) [Magnetospirillum sp. XM-1]|uniref:B12-binding domain-containing radical SAM protein n=1 Tax=Magnetospirillum sp. XM-1 TaxID=1663591 RepID=UPI00073DD966|nr:radical SAM protein [Magnetospirillum sp. XM-1]CUW38878.1 putative Radical SAM domain-containing protein(Radical SAM, alpha/beta horseshoe,221-414) [Magnetospirillum sp. XM-1]
MAQAKTVDILFVHPGDAKKIYQGLADEFAALEPPLFAGLYATYVRNKGMVPAIFDAPAMRASAEETARTAVNEYDARLVVVVVYGQQPSASTQNMGAAGRIARQIKALKPDLPIMMVGTHPAALPEMTMREEAVDFVCDLEGPITIFKTAQALKDGGSNAFAAIPSLWWRDGERIVAPTSAEPLIRDLDTELPGVAWDLLPMDRYRAHNWHSFGHIERRAPYASIHTSLGCPYKCNFCCINAPFGKSSYRMWSPAKVVEEIDHLVKTYGVYNIKISDEMFVLNRAHVIGICQMLAEKPYKVNIWAYARVDTVDDEILPILKAGGVNWLCLGIESASGEVRDGAAKKYTNQDIIDVVRRIQAAGIHIIGNYIFGLPDDTIERMQATLDLALELNCEFINFYSAMAYPGSQLYRDAIAGGIELPETWDDFSQHGYKCRPLRNRHLTAAQILEFRDKAFMTYYTHQPYLDMIAEKFGQAEVDHIKRMCSIPLRRQLLEPQAAE